MNDIKASPAYVGRFQRVCRYIAHHLDEPLSLEMLSAIAHSSPYHFHRQFSAYTGIPLYRYIQWLRLRRACWRLAFNPRDKVIDIALDAGFQNAESFSRAFRTAFDQSPTQFRQQPDWAEWHRRVPKHTLQEQTSMDVNIISFPTTRIAVLQHRGSPDLVNATAARLSPGVKRADYRPSPPAIPGGSPGTIRRPPRRGNFVLTSAVRSHGRSVKTPLA